MTRGPKREIIRLTNERDFPHLVELALPPEGFRSILLEIDAFHRDRRIPVRRGRNRQEVKQVYIRFCFPDAAPTQMPKPGKLARFCDDCGREVCGRSGGGPAAR